MERFPIQTAAPTWTPLSCHPLSADLGPGRRFLTRDLTGHWQVPQLGQEKALSLCGLLVLASPHLHIQTRWLSWIGLVGHRLGCGGFVFFILFLCVLPFPPSLKNMIKCMGCIPSHDLRRIFYCSTLDHNCNKCSRTRWMP